MIYRAALVDETKYIVLLDMFFEGEKEDLPADDYTRLAVEADRVLDDPLSFSWE